MCSILLHSFLALVLSTTDGHAEQLQSNTIRRGVELNSFDLNMRQHLKTLLETHYETILRIADRKDKDDLNEYAVEYLSSWS